MPVRGGDPNATVSVEMDPRAAAQLAREVRAFGPELNKAFRKRLRTAGEVGKKAVQQRLRTAPAAKTSTGLREGLAKGTTVRTRVSAKQVQISVVTTGKNLPEAKQAMVFAYNKASFRHMVFGHADRWVPQRGRRYFGAVYTERNTMVRQANAALADAARTIRMGQVRSS